MLQVRSHDMFLSAYQQISEPERGFVDRLVGTIADEAQRYGARIADLIDAPLPDTLHKMDSRGWLSRPLVVAAITEKLRELQLRQDISLERIMRELHAIATFSLEDIMKIDDLGEPQIDLANATPEQWAAIKSIDFEKNDGLTRASKTKTRITTHDKLGALKMMADMMGAYDPDNPFRKADKTRSAPALTDDKSAQQAADEYQRYIEGE